ncbi:MAG TPA: 2TM domain-containing protein [Streptosporangiaceae bacterium]|nr:2TM domain-containing protein [Streptosporangiaceae bacterium]
MTHDIFHDTPAGSDPGAPATSGQLARQQAIKQIERRRRFWVSSVAATASMILLVVIWATSEYHNAGGWPVHGFSQSSGIHDVWNLWIIYPLGVWVLLTAVGAWFVYQHRPISESDIRREMQRQGQRP